jgi:50S ribosomal protein L16 3-hydroxylase
MKTIGLANLISPHAPETFLSETWPKKPFVVHGLGETVSSLREIPFLSSLDALLNSWPGTIQAHLPEVSDESSSVDGNAAEARNFFSQRRMGLLFNNVEKQSPILKEWLKALKKDLGLPVSTYARCIVYATPDGKGTAAHFDQNINFVLQLHGSKKWWLAENDFVENPTERFTIGQPLDPELESYALKETPTSAPKSKKEYVLEPGSMLFVPRGYWHGTEADGDALALNFTLSQPTWIDLFTLALKSRLSLSPDWRELADGVTSRDEGRRKTAEKKFDLLLIDLVEDLPNWRAADILGATEGEFDRE